MENYLDHDPIFFTGRAPDQLPVFSTHQKPTTNTRLQDYSKIFKHIYVGTFFAIYVSLIGFIQMKFQNLNHSPFDTHGFFIIMSLIALPIAIMTSGILLYTNDAFGNAKISIIRHMLLIRFTSNFSTVLAVLSLYLILFFPSKLKWIGYAIVCALFVVMVIYYVCSYIRVLKKKDAPNFVACVMV